ncbi:hypothetical protein [Natronococcus sp. A-GB7]|uniref:hypothetical protein n=1 Tax=Natronococcus sp. A-GB7 TaxID=3037649 RepID=UPI00241F28E8|nr:hypothetical protein [Natronococcus sp. A-GB7]MDG5821148.1 hypothetical protein [Natronococcus sp. A-GB7]
MCVVVEGDDLVGAVGARRRDIGAHARETDYTGSTQDAAQSKGPSPRQTETGRPLGGVVPLLWSC